MIRIAPLLTRLKLAVAAVSLGIALGVSGSAVAQERPPPPKRPAVLMPLYAGFGVVQTLDAQSTLRALRSGQAHEANPIMAPFTAHPPAFIADFLWRQFFFVSSEAG